MNRIEKVKLYVLALVVGANYIMISGPSHVKVTLSKPQIRSSKGTFLPVYPATSLHILSCRFILLVLFILWCFAWKVFEIFIQISPFGEVIYLN